MARVAALELPARWNDARAALDETDALLACGPACDLALLPEASLTGYLSPDGDADLRRFAEPPDGATTRALADLARAHRTAIAGPLIEKDGDRYYNALVVVDAEGRTVARYRKRHPWFPERWATSGEDAPPTFVIAGARFTTCICFDVHFVAAEASEALRSADVLLFPSAWVDEKDDARTPLLASIARNFGVAIVNANWGLGTPRIFGQGASSVFSPDGEVIVRAESVSGVATRVDAELPPRME